MAIDIYKIEEDKKNNSKLETAASMKPYSCNDVIYIFHIFLIIYLKIFIPEVENIHRSYITNVI